MKRMKGVLVVFLMMMVVLVGCGSEDPAKEESSGSDQSASTEYVSPAEELELGATKHIDMKTSMGTIKLELYPEVAPKAVENFVTHAEQGYYDGLTFHRVMDGFMIQGGDPNGNGSGGESIYGAPFEDEFSKEALNYRGALSMANSGPNTNGSQFFIVQAPTSGYRDSEVEAAEAAGYTKEQITRYENGGTPWLDGKHTVFGYVTEGMDVVDEIAAVDVDEQSQPKKPVVIEKMTVID